MINLERLKETFIHLVRLASPSKQEGLVASYVKEYLNELGIEWVEDKAADALGATCGNIIGWLDGEGEIPLMLNAHLDTVQKPAEEVVVREENGILKSDGTTILGADDKSGVAIILEVLRVIKENNLPHPPLQPVFTICEEIGLLGAKHLDYSLLKAKWGLVLDGGNPAEIIHRAPTANRLQFVVIGKAAHAGVHPEEGINAIWLAAKAISSLQLGRIDEETTCNLGLIEGGTATNIVPDKVVIKGEVRSHKQEKLKAQTEKIINAFKETIEAAPKKGDLPKVEINVKDDYPLMYVKEDHPLIQLVKRAGEKVGLEMQLKVSGGGSDANIFNDKGIVSIIMGTGMKKVHTCEEFIPLQDMEKSANLLLNILILKT
jgi:tripeptide aminopeptidase